MVYIAVLEHRLSIEQVEFGSQTEHLDGIGIMADAVQG
jgi:hypothetical protein